LMCLVSAQILVSVWLGARSFSHTYMEDKYGVLSHQRFLACRLERVSIERADNVPEAMHVCEEVTDDGGRQVISHVSLSVAKFASIEWRLPKAELTCDIDGVYPYPFLKVWLR